MLAFSRERVDLSTEGERPAQLSGTVVSAGRAKVRREQACETNWQHDTVLSDVWSDAPGNRPRYFAGNRGSALISRIWRICRCSCVEMSSTHW